MPVDTALSAATPALRPPASETGLVGWMRKNLFSSVGNSILTVVCLFFLYRLVAGALDWAVFSAVFTGEDGSACRGEGKGACWPFVKAKFSQFIYGRYPEEMRWRVSLTFILALAGIIPLMIPAIPWKGFQAYYTLIVFPIIAYWLLTGVTVPVELPAAELADIRSKQSWWYRIYSDARPYIGLSLLSAAAVSVLLSFVARQILIPQTMRLLGGILFTMALPYLIEMLFVALDQGKILGLAATNPPPGPHNALPVVKTERWGGLLVTLVVASVGITCSYPVGIILALGRRSQMPIARWASVFFIETVRAVPLITILFMSSVMLPYFLPPGMEFDKLLRALVGVALFAGAYMAETIRGGLQAIPRGQFEAADALGLSYPKKMGLIVLPQALKLVIPGIVNSFVGLFKDTSLVLIIGLFDLLNIVQFNLTDAKWFAPQTAMTGYVFAAAFFWFFCFAISRYSQWLEKRLRTDHK
ncbi:MAG TPA: amino acid ABC transporter permease [Hyphomicrobiaceae bacterium]|nr:amino acid ABC transporter permease [Hyphomicrobiaceae bacterium]